MSVDLFLHNAKHCEDSHVFSEKLLLAGLEKFFGEIERLLLHDNQIELQVQVILRQARYDIFDLTLKQAKINSLPNLFH